MAQIIQIPLSVEFLSQCRQWEAFSCEIAGFRSEFLPKSGGLVAPIGIVSDRQDFAIRIDRGARGVHERQSLFTMHGPNADEYLKRIFAPNGNLYGVSEGYGVFDIVACFGKSKGQPHMRDPWEMRDEFLGLKNTSAALIRFLNKWGDWNNSVLFEILEHWMPLTGGETNPSPRFVIPELVWEQQRFYTAAIAGSAKDWMSNYGRVPTLARLSTYPFFQTGDSTCSTAIESTITMDKLREIPYRLCALEGCGKPFPLNTRHDKLYCSTEHAHHASVKRGREAMRKAKMKQEGEES